MGLSFITEGAIPFGAADPARAIPSFILGSAVAGGLVGLAGIKLMAPHGGIFVIALTSNALLYLVSVLVNLSLKRRVATKIASGGTIPPAITAAIATEPPEETVAASVPVPKT